MNEHNYEQENMKEAFLITNISKMLLALNLIMATLYFVIITFALQRGNLFFFMMLIIGEVFHLWQIIGFIHTIWSTEKQHRFDLEYSPKVDVLIPVAGEPLDVIEETVVAAKNMRYPNFTVYICSDFYVANKENWKDVEKLAKKHSVRCITRKEPGGFKAGNLNHTLNTVAKSPLIAVFDSDHVPHEDFLEKTVGYFVDEKMGFVQSPQFYKNYNVNAIAGTAWEQQALFFGPLLKGKNRLNSVFMCGTNMVIRREALDEVGGMCEFNIAEDFLTSLFIHEKGWKSVYVPEVLAEGYAPEDFLSYYKQQFRWTRGSLEVIFKFNPLFRKGLTWNQKLQYLASASYYLSGAVVFMNAILPLSFLYFGIIPILSSTMVLASIFIPYIFLNLYILQLSSNFSYTFRALSFSISSFPIHIKAIWAVLTNQKTKFAVTSKQQLTGNFLYLVTPHILYIILVVIGIEWAIIREGVTASVITNMSWALLNAGVFIPFIVAAAPKIELHEFFSGMNLAKQG